MVSRGSVVRILRPESYWFQVGGHPIHPPLHFLGARVQRTRAALRCARALGRSPPPFASLCRLSRSSLSALLVFSLTQECGTVATIAKSGDRYPVVVRFEKVNYAGKPRRRSAAASAAPPRLRDARLRARCLHLAFALSLFFRRCDEQLRVGRADGGGGAEGEGEGEGEGLDYNASSSPCTS